jgi:uncharacterized protein GlcG (DUF336 family)
MSRWKVVFWLLAIALARPAYAQLTADDVTLIIKQAASRAAEISPKSVIAVTNREGFVLGIWNVAGGEPTAPQIATCVSKAGTASFLSSDQNAFTSRTAAFIIQQHFPPGVNNTPTGPLVGVGLSNLFFSDINLFKGRDPMDQDHLTFPATIFSPQPGLAVTDSHSEVPLTSLDGAPGGVPLYKDGHLVGGIGVTGDGTPPPADDFRDENPFIFIASYDKDEDVALSGQIGFKPSSEILASNVFINGISLEYVESTTSLPKTLTLPGNAATNYPIVASPPPFAYPVATMGGVEGQIRQPIMDDPIPGTINGQARLTASEVTGILALGADRARTTRAGIRLPIGVPMQVFITVVNFPNQDGITPTVLGTFRTGEATLFSWDVAVQKARTALAYSNNGNTMAMSTRTVGFLAQSHYPPGIDANHAGPYFGQQEMFSGLTGTLSNVAPKMGFIPDPNLPNGITIFPGGFPLYRNGQLIGAIGVSGDGVDQDDIVGASGTENFLAPPNITADEFTFEDARLPYAKFPRDPSGTTGEDDAVILSSPHALMGPSGLANISCRLSIGAGDTQAIAGFIIGGTGSKDVVVRAVGPSLSQFGISNALPNPALEIHDQAGNLITTNNDWKSTQEAAIEAVGLALLNEKEAAVKLTLTPGAYTAVMQDETGTAGVGLIEVYDIGTSSGSVLSNLSTRGYVGTGDDVMIGGMILDASSGYAQVVIRALGPSLAASGVTGVLADPTLELHDANGATMGANDNWEDTQALDLAASNLAPPDPQESALMVWLTPGAYTAIVRGNNNATGIGLLEAYSIQ